MGATNRITCPDHGPVEPRLAWAVADGKLHLGGRCPECNLCLKWLPTDTKGAPKLVWAEALR